MGALSNYDEFMASLESLDISVNEDNVSIVEQQTIDSVFANVKNFIATNNLVQPEYFHSLESLETATKSLNKAVDVSGVGIEPLIALCQNCNVPSKHLKAAVESVAQCIHNYCNNYGASQHFAKGSAPSANHGDYEVRGFDGIFSDRMNALVKGETASSLESFGADVSNVISDAKVAITVTILRYHRGAIHRLIPNIPTDSVMVSYKVDHMEVYDLAKSRSDNAAERYDDKHRVPFVDLYGDPSPANTQLKPIVLRTANDQASPNNRLIAENVGKINTSINMFDYSIDAGQIGYTHIDFTDIVADNVRIKALYVNVSDGSSDELFRIVVSEYAGARMLMNANNLDSADRTCNFKDILVLGNDSKTSSDVTSTLLGGLTDDAVVKLMTNASGSVNLKTSEIIVLASTAPSVGTVSGNAVIAADQTIFDGLTFTVVGFEPAAEFSEENIRKTTRAMRIMTKQVSYEIPGSQNFVVQYSLTQTRPETVIDGLAKLMALGNDDRGIRLIMDTMGNVKDRIVAESKLTSENYVNKIGQAFVSGQRVKPAIFFHTIEIDAELKNMRSADKWGDIRALAEENLLNILSRLYRESYYSQELGDGEKPVFNCLTSIPIKSSLLSVPHYHNHLADSAADKVADGVIEFRRTLPDGTVLNVITTTFNYMDDKIIMVPVRPARPQSILNFAQNRERGQFLAQATPTINDSIFNSVIGNSREFPIVTCPVGAIVQVSGLHAIFDTFGAL